MIERTMPAVTGMVAVLLLLAPTAYAQQVLEEEEATAYQDGYYFIPSLTVSRLWDDNVFFALDPDENAENVEIDRERVSDEVTSIAPAIEAGYASDRLNWLALYRVESQSYAEQEQLDSNDARRLAEVALQYLPTRLMTLDFTASYAETQTPGELNLLTGFEPGRFEASRLSFQSGLVYQVSADTTADVELTVAKNQLVTGVDGDTLDLEAGWQKLLGRQDTIIYGYSYRQYEFDTGASQYSHTPTIGWAHQVSNRTAVELNVGPRITNESTEPYVGLTLIHTYETGRLNFGYELGETYLIGETGRLEAESVNISLRQDIGDNLTVSFTPFYGKVDRGGSETESYRLALNATYEVNDALSLFATYDHNRQEDNLQFLGDRNFSRDVYFIGFTLALPRPSARNTE